MAIQNSLTDSRCVSSYIFTLSAWSAHVLARPPQAWLSHVYDNNSLCKLYARTARSYGEPAADTIEQSQKYRNYVTSKYICRELEKKQPSPTSPKINSYLPSLRLSRVPPHTPYDFPANKMAWAAPDICLLLFLVLRIFLLHAHSLVLLAHRLVGACVLLLVISAHSKFIAVSRPSLQGDRACSV